jgi:hypothetical protein
VVGWFGWVALLVGGWVVPVFLLPSFDPSFVPFGGAGLVGWGVVGWLVGLVVLVGWVRFVGWLGWLVGWLG